MNSPLLIQLKFLFIRTNFQTTVDVLMWEKEMCEFVSFPRYVPVGSKEPLDL